MPQIYYHLHFCHIDGEEDFNTQLKKVLQDADIVHANQIIIIADKNGFKD